MFSRLYTKDSDLNRVQDAIKNQFDSIENQFSAVSKQIATINSGIFSETQIEQVSISITFPTVITSTLSKPITGWIVIQKDKNATIYQSAIDATSVSLKSSVTPTTCTILLF